MTVRIINGRPLGYRGLDVKQLPRGSTVIGSSSGKLFMVMNDGLLCLTDGNTLVWDRINDVSYFLEVDLEITVK